MYKKASIFEGTQSMGNLPAVGKQQAIRSVLDQLGDSISVQNPHSSIPGDRINMSPEQWRATFDKDYRKANPATAANNAYYHPYQSDRTLGYSLGQKARNLMEGGMNTIEPYLNKGPLVGGLASLVPGAALGMLGTGAINLLAGNDLTQNMGRNALLTALVTGGIGAASGYLRKNKPIYTSEPAQDKPMSAAERAEDYNNQKMHVDAIMSARNALNKSASVIEGYIKKASMAQSEIIQSLQNAPGLSFNEKSQLIAGVSRLSGYDQQALFSTISQYGGMAIGAIVAKFLMNKGLLGTVMGAIFGGAVAKAIFGQKPETNYTGQQSLGNTTYTGVHY